MTKMLEQALAQMALLPKEDQEQIGRRLLSHIRKLRKIREDIDEGIRSLETGEGTTLDINAFLDQKNPVRARA